MKKNNALVVDDNKNLGELLGNFVRNAGFEVICCQDGEAALEAAKKHRFQVIITDYRMPGMFGTELARMMRGRYPKAFIIGISLDSLEREFLAAGADVFIPKTHLQSELMSLLERLVQRKKAN